MKKVFILAFLLLSLVYLNDAKFSRVVHKENSGGKYFITVTDSYFVGLLECEKEMYEQYQLDDIYLEEM